MTIDENTTQETFDRLFTHLLVTLTEEKGVRSAAGGLTELVDVRDRLHAIRSELAVARQNFPALGIPTEPTSDAQPPDCDCHAIAAEHPWGIRNLAA